MTEPLELVIETDTGTHSILCSKDELSQYEPDDEYLSLSELIEAAIKSKVGGKAYQLKAIGSEKIYREPIKTIAEYVEKYYKHGEPIRACANLHGIEYLEMLQYYYGEFQSLEDLAKEKILEMNILTDTVKLEWFNLAAVLKDVQQDYRYVQLDPNGSYYVFHKI